MNSDCHRLLLFPASVRADSSETGFLRSVTVQLQKAGLHGSCKLRPGVR